jgi:oligopeptide/dipeptide ABC transporter ATP-binding protein
VIELNHLTKEFAIREGLGRKTVHAVTDVSLAVRPSEPLAIVGESGCGKSTLGRIIAGLIEPTSGQMRWDEQVLRPSDAERWLKYRRTVQLIHQDPYAALNPVRRIQAILAEPLLAHKMVPRAKVNARISELLVQVGLDPELVLASYPHQLSGGQRQRILVARAMTVGPQFLVADEAVSMVDVSQRLGILELFRSIMADYKVGLVFITHDLRVARYIAGPGQMAVMYLGRVVESGPTEMVLDHPQHPYTQCLVSAVPLLKGREQGRLVEVVPRSYDVPDAVQVPPGCAFEPRCPYAMDICRVQRPLLVPTSTDTVHQVACHRLEEIPVEIRQSG